MTAVESEGQRRPGGPGRRRPPARPLRLHRRGVSLLMALGCALSAIGLAVSGHPAHANGGGAPAAGGGPAPTASAPQTGRPSLPPGPVGGPKLGATKTAWADGTPAPPAVPGTAYVVADAGTGQVLAARAPHQKVQPASTLKTLSVLAAVRSVDTNTVVTATKADTDVECTCVGIQAGQKYTMDHLLAAMLLRSGNDAANTMTEGFGSRAAGLAAMNTLAGQLGANDTHATTPSGLDDPVSLTSAYDLTLVARAGLADPRFMHYFDAMQYPFGAVGGPSVMYEAQDPLYHLNYAGQLGAKFGWTTPAGYTIVGAAKRGGRTLIVTLLGSDPQYGAHAAALLDWGFATATTAQGLGTLVNANLPPGPASSPSPHPSPSPSRTPAAVSAAMPGGDRRSTAPDTSPILTVGAQSGLSLGAVAFTGLALLPGRRPRRHGRRLGRTRRPGRHSSD